jgi:hypothetical protein
VRINTWDSRQAAPEPPTAQPAPQQAQQALPALQPISSSLARQLRREQQQRKRMYKQLQSLERQLQASSSSSSALGEAGITDGLQLPGAAADMGADDPLFDLSSGSPSVQQLQRLLVHRRSQLLRATSSSISDVTRGKASQHLPLPIIACCLSTIKRRKLAHLAFVKDNIVNTPWKLSQLEPHLPIPNTPQ